MSKLVLLTSNRGAQSIIYQIIETGHLLLVRDHLGPVNLTLNMCAYNYSDGQVFPYLRWTTYDHIQSITNSIPIRLLSIYSFEIC